MPPNTGSGTMLEQFTCSYKQAANPYSDTKHACFEECPGASGGGRRREHEAPESAVDDTVRVTTRARLTYDLYNYSKNAMLIVDSTINAFESDIKIKEFEATFAKFRFEVDVVNIGLNNIELYEKCDQYFQRDFTDYGAVALVILSDMALGQSSVRGFKRIYFKETKIVDNFKLERNPTLVDKPKIYITEVGRGYWSILDEYLNVPRLEHATHGDVIGFHSRAIDNIVSVNLDELTRRRVVENGPLVRFCKKLATMGDNMALPDIIAQTKSDDIDYQKKFIPQEFIPLNTNNLADRIRVVDTLNKALYFARTEDS